MEFFDLIVIVPVREVLLLEILLELFPHNLPFINLLHLLLQLQLFSQISKILAPLC